MNTYLVSAMRWFPWLVASGALALTLQALLGQVGLQSELNAAMVGVHSNLREAVELTHDTAEALHPLTETTVTLERINGRLRDTGQDLDQVNGILERMVGQQRGMRDTLTGLIGRSSAVVSTLEVIDQTNSDLLTTTGSVADQTERQASVLERLRLLTSESIGQLRSLNQKFAFLAR